MNIDALAELSENLSELFAEHVQIRNNVHRELGETRISIVDMTYIIRGSDGHHSHITQTAVVLTQDDLNVPEFTLRPTVKGIAGKFFSVFGNMGDINFDDSPKFSEAYHLHGWIEESVRVLFIPEIRDHFARNRRWSVRGRGQQLVIFQHNTTIQSDEHDRFVKSTLAILELFQQGEEVLDDRPELRRESRADDMSATADRMDGVIGSMLKRQLDKVRVTPTQLDEFADANTPRTAPAGLHRQVMGQIMVVVCVGIVMAIVGAAFALVVWMIGEGNARYIAIPTASMSVLGCVVTFFAWRFRGKKSRVLRHGLLQRGLITDVKRTEMKINDQQQYLVTVEYQEAGIRNKTQCKIYGLVRDRAKAMKDAGEAVRVLIDPKDPKNVICLDLLMIFDR